MTKVSFLARRNFFKNHYSKDSSQKIFASLVAYVYQQANIGVAASMFCASIIFIGLFFTAQHHALLFIWAGFFIIVSVLRLILIYFYKKETHPENRILLWHHLYVISTFFAGLSWGLLGVLLFPNTSSLQQTLMVLMAAGVTAGIVPLSSAIPLAAVGFLIFTIVPFIISIALLKNDVYHLFDVALFLYLIYTVIVVIKGYHLIRQSIALRFENDILLNNLYEAKKQLEATNKKLEQAATHDPLTQVANRSLFETNFNKALKHAAKSQTILALLYLDIDHFKLINDSYGHHVGDHLLLIVIERLKNFFGTDEHIARLGGDEITIIQGNVTHVNEVAMVAKELCQLMARSIKMGHIDMKITISIGISLYPDDGADIETLLRCADKNMYYVKWHGGNNYHFSREFAENE